MPDRYCAHAPSVNETADATSNLTLNWFRPGGSAGGADVGDIRSSKSLALWCVIAKHIPCTEGQTMLQNHWLSTGHNGYALFVLCCVCLMGLIQFENRPLSSVRATPASLAQKHTQPVAGTAQDAQAQAAARLCRGVKSSIRCGTFTGTWTTL
jgi:hypothetical protein